MKRITSIALLFSTSLVSATFSFAKHTDPCDEIPGRWTGTLISPMGGGIVEAIGTKGNNNINFTLKSCYAENNCPETIGDIQGTCSDGRMLFPDANMTGTVFDNIIVLKGDAYITLKKRK